MARPAVGRAVVGLLIGAWGCASAATSPPPSTATSCAAVATFADTTPRSIRHVATHGSDDAGDGSADRPYLTLARAVRGVEPGVAIYLHAGDYAGGVSVDALRGTADAPIWIAGAPGEAKPRIRGGHQGLYLRRPRYLVVERLEVEGTNDNGINVDDGDEVGDPDAARHLVFRDLDVHDTGRRPSGVPDCLKLAGANDVLIERGRFARCGTSAAGAAGVNGVGVHRVRVIHSTFTDTGFGGVQVKGGSSDVDVSGSRFERAGDRGVNMGGATGGPFFRPPLTRDGVNVEASRVNVVGNTFDGGESAAAFTGCVDCVFSENSVVRPTRWLLRILQETVSHDGFAFAPAGHGAIERNAFVFRRADLNTGEDINVGRDTDAASFRFERNQLFVEDAGLLASARDRVPRLPPFRQIVPAAATPAVSRPSFVDEARGDYRVATDRRGSDTPTIGAALACPAGA